MLLRYVSRALIVMGIAVAVYFLKQTMQHYSAEQISHALRALPFSSLALALGFAGLSYFCLGCGDALAARALGKRLAFWQTALASFISLSISHNIGLAALSSAALRYRYYSRWGLSSADVGFMVLFCGMTVALGLSTLGSVALVLRPEDTAKLTGLGDQTILALAIVAACLPLMYVALAAFWRKTIAVFGHEFSLPTVRIAVLQVVLGTLNFIFVAASLHQLLTAISNTGYIKVAAISIIANLAAIITHVPGGFGVLEATVSHILPGAETLACVIAFRVVYYFIPLLLGLLLMGANELVLFWRASPKPSAQKA